MLKSNRFWLSNETGWCLLLEGGLQLLQKDPINQSWNCSIVSECEFPAGNSVAMTWFTELEGLFIVAQPFDRFRLLPQLSNNSFASYWLRWRSIDFCPWLRVHFLPTLFRFLKIVPGNTCFAITYPPAKIKQLNKGERELASEDPYSSPSIDRKVFVVQMWLIKYSKFVN